MKGIETVPNAIKILINIFNGTLEIGLLFYGEFGSSSSVRGLVLSML